MLGLHSIMNLYVDMKEINEEALKRQRQRWKDSMKLPRKKKKKIRKDIISMYSIFLHMKDNLFKI